MEIVNKICLLWILTALKVLPATSGVILRSGLRHVMATEFFARAPLKTHIRSLVPAKFENSVLRKSIDESGPIIVLLRKKNGADVKTQKMKTEKSNGEKILQELRNGMRQWNKHPQKIGITKVYDLSDLVI